MIWEYNSDNKPNRRDELERPPEKKARVFNKNMEFNTYDDFRAYHLSFVTEIYTSNLDTPKWTKKDIIKANIRLTFECSPLSIKQIKLYLKNKNTYPLPLPRSERFKTMKIHSNPWEDYPLDLYRKPKDYDSGYNLTKFYTFEERFVIKFYLISKQESEFSSSNTIPFSNLMNFSCLEPHFEWYYNEQHFNIVNIMRLLNMFYNETNSTENMTKYNEVYLKIFSLTQNQMDHLTRSIFLSMRLIFLINRLSMFLLQYVELNATADEIKYIDENYATKIFDIVKDLLDCIDIVPHRRNNTMMSEISYTCELYFGALNDFVFYYIYLKENNVFLREKDDIPMLYECFNLYNFYYKYSTLTMHNELKRDAFTLRENMGSIRLHHKTIMRTKMKKTKMNKNTKRKTHIHNMDEYCDLIRKKTGDTVNDRSISIYFYLLGLLYDDKNITRFTTSAEHFKNEFPMYRDMSLNNTFLENFKKMFSYCLEQLNKIRAENIQLFPDKVKIKPTKKNTIVMGGYCKDPVNGLIKKEKRKNKN